MELNTKTNRAKFIRELEGKSLGVVRNLCEVRGLNVSTWKRVEFERADNGRRIVITNRVNLVVDYDSLSPKVVRVFFG